MINYLILLSLIFIIGILIYLLFSIKNKETVDQGGNESLQNKLNEVSNDINKIEIDFKISEIRDEIISFVRNSGRGIMRGYNQK